MGKWLIGNDCGSFGKPLSWAIGDEKITKMLSAHSKLSRAGTPAAEEGWETRNELACALLEIGQHFRIRKALRFRGKLPSGEAARVKMKIDHTVLARAERRRLALELLGMSWAQAPACGECGAGDGSAAGSSGGAGGRGGLRRAAGAAAAAEEPAICRALPLGTVEIPRLSENEIKKKAIERYSEEVAEALLEDEAGMEALMGRGDLKTFIFDVNFVQKLVVTADRMAKRTEGLEEEDAEQTSQTNAVDFWNARRPRSDFWNGWRLSSRNGLVERAAGQAGFSRAALQFFSLLRGLQQEKQEDRVAIVKEDMRKSSSKFRTPSTRRQWTEEVGKHFVAPLIVERYEANLRGKLSTEAAMKEQAAVDVMVQETSGMEVFLEKLNEVFPTRDAASYVKMREAVVAMVEKCIEERRIFSESEEPLPDTLTALKTLNLAAKKLFVLQFGRLPEMRATPVWQKGNPATEDEREKVLEPALRAVAAFVDGIVAKVQADEVKKLFADWARDTLITKVFLGGSFDTYAKSFSYFATGNTPGKARNRHGHGPDFPSYRALGYKSMPDFFARNPEGYAAYKEKHTNCCGFSTRARRDGAPARDPSTAEGAGRGF